MIFSYVGDTKVYNCGSEATKPWDTSDANKVNMTVAADAYPHHTMNNNCSGKSDSVYLNPSNLCLFAECKPEKGYYYIDSYARATSITSTDNRKT